MKADLSGVKTLGQGLLRPEGVMALDDGTLLASDGRGRLARIEREGRTAFFGDLGGVPNGICLDAFGNAVVANIGNGQVQSLSPQGRHEVLLTEAQGRPLPTPNFPLLDSQGRLWVSNSTARRSLDQALRDPAPDGSVVLLRGGRARVAAEGICFANGLALDPEEKHLYVAETLLRRVLRFRIEADGSLSHRQIYGPPILSPQGFPDGIAFDEGENLWITFPAWNAVGYLTPRQELKVVLHDPQRRVLQRPSNICFGWEDRKTAFIGSLDGTTIPHFQVPSPGARLIHQR